jgi:hypothetical protein
MILGSNALHTVTVPDLGPGRQGAIGVAACSCGWESEAMPFVFAWKAGQAHLDA